MPSFTILAASALLAAASVSAQSPSTVGSPVLNQCQTAAFTISCLDPPCAVAMRPSNSTSSSYAYFQGLTTGVLSWAPYVPAGTNLTAYLTDKAGLPNFSGALIVNPGLTDCEPVMGYTVNTDGTTSTLSSSASATQGAHTAAESAKPAATTSNKTADSAAASSKPDSAAGKVAQSGLALGAVVAAGLVVLL